MQILLFQELQDLADEVIGEEKFHQVAMGQGQADIALQLLHDCSRNGEWLCLKNLHLVNSWLPTLEKVTKYFAAIFSLSFIVAMSNIRLEILLH